ncbi:hypothetical protein L596_013486 [Steinernema carpocapsae]|uniref:BPTI/Kunitz inhibitor domain-containing protein n=1 Tax=Steinernema carpocapsae TaxID=34508 RepID=A0A4U5P0G0_STECR|nr:hypothetical protein L596_013486 [Steinernema carpocapsae]
MDLLTLDLRWISASCQLNLDLAKLTSQNSTLTSARRAASNSFTAAAAATRINSRVSRTASSGVAAIDHRRCDIPSRRKRRRKRRLSRKRRRRPRIIEWKKSITRVVMWQSGTSPLRTRDSRNVSRLKAKLQYKSCETFPSGGRAHESQVNVLSDAVTNAEFDVQPTEDAIRTTEIVYAMPTSNLPDMCQQPEERGSCYDEILRWRYSMEDGECIGFLYTGCDANANHFTSEEECERACGPFRDLAVCKMPKSAGNCKRPTTKWWYNAETRECTNFMWTGCGGNGNRFSTKAECEHLCALEEKSENVTNVCDLERDSGPCTDAVSQWYFSKEDGECRKFTYGGCRGNGNRFDTKEQCEGKCAVKSQNLILFEPMKVCAFAFEKGPCSASEKQFYFDINNGRCRSFTYGGCEGNSNRFESKELCYQFCGSVKEKKRPQS